jgi:hypothetical protein
MKEAAVQSLELDRLGFDGNDGRHE